MRVGDRSEESAHRRSSPHHRLASLLGCFAVTLLPAALAAAWIPIRARVADLDLALVLVVLLMGIGLLERRVAVDAAAVVAALAFEFFDTRPFDRLVIARQPDIETTIVLGIVGGLAGECVLRLRRHQAASRWRATSLLRVGTTAGLLATGEEVGEVVSRTSAQLCDLLDLVDCRFEAVSPDPGAPLVERDGGLVVSTQSVRGAPSGAGTRWSWTMLPVFGQGVVIGRFVLYLRPDARPTREQMLVAVLLSDQVGAAFSAYGPPAPPPPGDNEVIPAPLRLLH